jgi:hypothetical protein
MRSVRLIITTAFQPIRTGVGWFVKVENGGVENKETKKKNIPD